MSTKSKRTEITEAAASLALGAAIIVWGAIRGFTPIAVSAGIPLSLVLAGFAWLGWRALKRHRALAARAEGPYLARHSGLVWGVGLSGALTYTIVREPLARASGVEEQIWLLALLGVVCVPLALWGGLVFRRTLERGLGITPPDAWK